MPVRDHEPACAPGVIMSTAAEEPPCSACTCQALTVGAASATKSAETSTAAYASAIWSLIHPPICRKPYTSNRKSNVWKTRFSPLCQEPMYWPDGTPGARPSCSRHFVDQDRKTRRFAMQYAPVGSRVPTQHNRWLLVRAGVHEIF